MTRPMKPWLPQTALAQGSIEPTLLHVLRQWSANWLVGGDPETAPTYQDNFPAPSASVKWRSSAVAAVAFREGSLWTLASAMLDHSIAPASLRPSDRKILEALAATAVDDLLCRLSELDRAKELGDLCSLPIDLKGCAWWEVRVAAGKPMFKLALSESLLVKIIKRGLPVAEKIALGSIAEGLAEQNVTLSVELGRCSISLADLKELGVGDVLVLDRLSQAPVDVMVDDRSALLYANLEDSDGCTALTIAPKEMSHA